jgi:hypothetical protein
MAREPERGGLIWPLLLILVGGIILLNNIGITSIDLWDATLRLWPVILMAVGIELLIPRRSIWGTLLALVLILGIFALAYFGMSGIQVTPAAAQRIDQPLAAATTANLVFGPAVGSVEITGGTSAGALVSGTVVPLSGERVETRAVTDGDTASVTVETSGSSGGILVFPSSRGRWELSISEAIPLTVRADLGVGSLTLDLSQVQATEIAAEIGVGRLELYLPSGSGTQVRLKGGLGSTVVWLPVGAAAEIDVAHDLATLSLPEGTRESGGFIYTGGANAESANLHLAIEQSIGSVSVRQR